MTLVTLLLTLVLATMRPMSSMAQMPPNCAELIVNGSFEQPGSGWKPLAGSSLFTYANDQTVDGRHALLLGFATSVNITATFGVEQLLTLPAASTSIDIGFAYAVATDSAAGGGGADEGDQALLTIHDDATNQLLAMVVFSPTDGAWHLGRYDLTPLAGKEVRLAFMSQNDGGAGRLTMRVDDVSITACLPPEAFALEALPTPAATPVPPTPEMLTLTPIAPPTSMPLSPTPGAALAPPQAQMPPAQMPQANELFPPAALIESLAQCSCASKQYACSSFSSWAVAQACYTHCQVTAGYDIHNLDPDRNGVACELELQDVAPLDATPSPQPTPSASDTISETNSADPATAPVSASLPITGPDVVTGANVVTGAASPTIANDVVAAGAMTFPVAAGAVTTNSTSSTDTVAVAAAPPVATLANPDAPANPPVAAPAAEITPTEMLSQLLFSPLGYFLLGALVIIGALGLWIAFLLGQQGGQRGQAPSLPPATKTMPTIAATQNAASNHAPNDDFTLSPNQEASARKT